MKRILLVMFVAIVMGTISLSATALASVVPDADGDGIVDVSDNCPDLYNPDQKDRDRDGDGDWCDNCRFVYNADQQDSDDDGFGDACIQDADGDGVSDEDDNCPTISNVDQADDDGDFKGDVCDVDPVASESPEEPRADFAVARNDGCSLVAGGGPSHSVVASGFFVLMSLLTLAYRRVRGL